MADRLRYRGRTLYTGIFTMTTVMLFESSGNAVLDKCLSSIAVYVIQKDIPRSLAETGASNGSRSEWKTELSAYYLSIVDVPVVITYCSPRTLVVEFNSAG